MEPRGFEPLTLAVQKRHNTLLERSITCRIPANCRISALALFPVFQEIHSGCTQVAARLLHKRGALDISTHLNEPTAGLLAACHGSSPSEVAEKLAACPLCV